MGVVLLAGICHNIDDFFACFKAVHVGHLQVHEYELIGPVDTLAGSAKALLEHFYSLLPVKRQVDLYLE